MATTETDRLLGAAVLPDLTRTVKELLAETTATLASSRQTSTAASGPLALEIEQLRAINSRQAEALIENTQALLQNTVARATGLQGAASSAGKWMLGVATGGISPLISGLVKLFTGGGKSEAPELLASYTRPDALAFEGTTAAGRGVVWRRAGEAEPIAAAAPRPATQITVQVQAMDSRSFLDRRDDIARAVRQAMLNSHSLNDVIADV